MSSTQTTIWLPVQPLESLAADSSELQYQIKTMVVAAKATTSCRDGVVRVQASAKIPFKSSFTYESETETGVAGPFAFKAFRESHGSGWRKGVAGTDSLAMDDGQKIAVPRGIISFVTLGQSLYALRGAEPFSFAYMGLLVGRHPHLVRFEHLGSGRYKIAALGLKHDDVVPADPSTLAWHRAHGAEILVRNEVIDEICVSFPLVGAVTIRRS